MAIDEQGGIGPKTGVGVGGFHKPPGEPSRLGELGGRPELCVAANQFSAVGEAIAIQVAEVVADGEVGVGQVPFNLKGG